MNKIIEFKNVYKSYGKGEGTLHALNDVSFDVNEGEFVVILGPSGAGKSTVLNLLGGMDKPTGGMVVVNGKNIAAYNDSELSDYRAADVGFIFQFYNLLPGLTAKENVALTKSIVKNALDAEEMLSRVGLNGMGRKFPSQMSGGEQQRVSIARALAKNPSIILGDEPTGALDSQTGKNILELIQNISQKAGNTVILVTHNADIAKCSDKVIKMKNGRVENIIVNENPKSVSEVNW